MADYNTVVWALTENDRERAKAAPAFRRGNALSAWEKICDIQLCLSCRRNLIKQWRRMCMPCRERQLEALDG
jgi:hypothetical protein